MQTPFVEIPNFRDSDAASAFDFTVFSCNPTWQKFLRRCLPIELPPGTYEEMCGPNEQLFAMVVKVFPDLHVWALFANSREQSPTDFCADLERDPEVAELIQRIRGGSYANN